MSFLHIALIIKNNWLDLCQKNVNIVEKLYNYFNSELTKRNRTNITKFFMPQSSVNIKPETKYYLEK